MKQGFFLFSFFLLSLNLFSQKENEMLFKVGKTPVSIGEFKHLFEKNSSNEKGKTTEEVKEYLTLFINFKLKVKEATELKLDTLPTLKRELISYQNQLAEQFIQDSDFEERLLKEAYERSKYQLKASHILVKLSENAKPQDTLKAYHKILEARKSIIDGSSFADVAKEYSEDPSVLENNGDLGYFTVFKMIYTFETAAYQTNKGQISMPFRTPYGFHIIKVEDVKASKGEREIAQILITDQSEKGKNKIDSLYAALSNGTDFGFLAKKFSNDKGSSMNGGKLPKMGYGRMFPKMEEVAFSLQFLNEISKPFKTIYGWHIFKLIKKYPFQSFAEARPGLQRKINSSGRAKLSNQALLKQLKKKYDIKVFEENKNVFADSNIRAVSNDSLQNTLFSINDKKVTQEDFKYYIYSRRQKPVSILFTEFFNESILQYFKANLIKNNNTYKQAVQEYKEGILLFELMNKNVWNRASADSVGLQKFFDMNKNKYTFNDGRSKDKSIALNDYQKYLDIELIAQLRKKYVVEISQESVKFLLEYYQKK